jgi:hypothetical protein
LETSDPGIIEAVKTDKEIALDLLGLERYTLEISSLWHLLNHSIVKDWQAQVSKMKQNAGARGMLHQDFQVWRYAILDSPDNHRSGQRNSQRAGPARA